MAVALPPLPELLPVPGLRLGCAQTGSRYQQRDDLVLFELPADAVVAAAFTRNSFRAAPVRIAEQVLVETRARAEAPRYLLVNAGNANAGTGRAGHEAALACCRAVAEQAGLPHAEVLPFSTGVIGEPLPTACLVAALPAAFADLSATGWARAAGAILTTDTAPKGACVALRERTGHVTGIAKGAGMIRPDMATMLAFLATDVPVRPAVLDLLFARAVEASFHRITVDGDTSTNDAALIVATGVGEVVTDPDSAAGLALGTALTQVCVELAQAIVRDGEGATRFVTVTVGGARDSEEALTVARLVAESPLVKTALFGGDPNWGRILAVIGRSGIDELNVNDVTLRFADEQGEILIAEQGARAATYEESAGARIMASAEPVIHIDLARGQVCETVWTTDLSYEYVRINADYRS